jgi:NAD(P)-dependent dehydrogenase (short-subunit alcohol dehydrogenase family)
MDIRGTRILLLGGSGLVGTAIARQLLPHQPSQLVISALTRREAEAAVDELRAEAPAAGVELLPAWGDVFVPSAYKDRRRAEILADESARGTLLDNLYGGVGEEAVDESALGALLLENRPDIVVDCINTATVLAYQNVFSSVAALRERARQGSADLEAVERHLATLYLPQLIHHVRVAMEGMRRAGTRMYIKIGTAGTGGMGLNIPFTHSEDRPSRMLLAKSSVAGAHTLLLYLMARTPGAPAVKEIKPTAAISWKRIGAGEIRRGGQPIARVDARRALPLDQAFEGDGRASGAWEETGEVLTGVYLDAGENGFFSPPEFEALTALGLMEFITPEEIALDVVREVLGYPTGHDVVAALDAATSGPTYRAGVLRQAALSHMEALEAETGTRCIAYEMLGPPRLSKLLFEAAILGRLFDDRLERAARSDAEETAAAARALVEEDADLRTRILSIGIPILLPDGERILRGRTVDVLPGDDGTTDPERLAERGWVDLRASNWRHWRERAAEILRRIQETPGVDHGSRADIEAWQLTRTIRPGALAAWVFRYEDGGERIRR